jgi:hypothetical protein
LIALRAAHPALWSLAFESLDSTDSSVYAYLRSVEGDAVLLVANFGGEATAEYALSATGLSLAPGRYLVTDLLAASEGASPSPLTVEPDGSVSGYQPLPELPSSGALVLQLAPAGQ